MPGLAWMLTGFVAWLRNLSGRAEPATPAHARARDAAEAKRLFRRAAKGDAGARRDLGRAYLAGRGVPASTAEAVRWLNLAIEGGDAEARLLLAQLHLRGLGHADATDLFAPQAGTADVPEAARLALEAAEGGSAEAMSLYAWLRATGQGAGKDHEVAAHWYARAAALGHAPGKLGLGLIRLHGMDGVTDAPAACRLVAEAAESGLPSALYVLGTLYEAAVPPLPFDEARAFGLYREAAEKGVRNACARYGLALLKGWGCEASPVEGERWLRRAAAAGDGEAAALVGDLQAHPADGSPANDTEALGWYQRAAEAGHVRAMRIVGLAYRAGRGTAPSEADAALWLERAAAHGDAEAAADLARMGSTAGNDTGQAREAADRVQALAEGGDLLSAFNYAVCLHLGVGRAKDPEGALRWMRHASERGQLNARYWLGRLLLEGGHDPVEAWRLIGEAAAEGVPEAGEMLRLRDARGAA